MRLRQGSLQDAPLLVSLMHQAFEEYRARLDPPSAAHDETVETVLKKLQKGSAIVAEVEGQPAGFVLQEPRGDCVYLSRLSVLPEFRKNRIASKLIEEVERLAAISGATCVRLGVRVHLPELVAFYERRGYRVTEYHCHPGYAEPTYLFMEKGV